MAENETTEVEEEKSEKETTQSPPAKESKPDFIQINGGKVKTSLDIQSMRKTLPEFSVGDTIEVHYKIREGDKQRIQVYTGNVISIRGEGLGKSFIVRRISHEIGVERIFPYHTPMIEKIKVIRKGKVRRAKLYYLRGKSGKEGRIKEALIFTARESATKPAKKKVAKKKTVKKTARKSTTKKSTSKKKAVSKNTKISKKKSTSKSKKKSSKK